MCLCLSKISAIADFCSQLLTGDKGDFWQAYAEHVEKFQENLENLLLNKLLKKVLQFVYKIERM